jgi:hypothetical protein
MGVVSIMLDAVGLMIGSLFCAGLLTFSAWWLAGRLHRPWTALVMLAVACGVMLVTLWNTACSSAWSPFSRLSARACSISSAMANMPLARITITPTGDFCARSEI